MKKERGRPHHAHVLVDVEDAPVGSLDQHLGHNELFHRQDNTVSAPQAHHSAGDARGDKGGSQEEEGERREQEGMCVCERERESTKTEEEEKEKR